jgi:hypothetical protein
MAPAFGNKSQNILKVLQSFGKYSNVIWGKGLCKTICLVVSCGSWETKASLDEPKNRGDNVNEIILEISVHGEGR